METTTNNPGRGHTNPLTMFTEEIRNVLDATNETNLESNRAVLTHLTAMIERLVNADPVAVEASTTTGPAIQYTGDTLCKTGVTPHTGRPWKHIVYPQEIERIVSLIQRQPSPLKPSAVIARSKLASYKTYVVLGALARLGLVQHERTHAAYFAPNGHKDFGYLNKANVFDQIRRLS